MKIELVKKTNNMTGITWYHVWVGLDLVSSTQDLTEAESKYEQYRTTMLNQSEILTRVVLREEEI